MEHSMSRTERPVVDSGTQAGIQVPVSDSSSIVTAGAGAVLCSVYCEEGGSNH